MPERIETDAAEFEGGVVAEVMSDEAVGRLMKRNGDDERQNPDRYVVEGDVQSDVLTGSTATLPQMNGMIRPNTAS